MRRPNPRPGEIMRRGNRLYIAGRQVDQAGRQVFWRVGGIHRKLYLRPTGMRPTGYNIHTNNPYNLDVLV